MKKLKGSSKNYNLCPSLIYPSLFIIHLFIIVSCQKPQAPIEENVYYTCSMDPQVMERHPGKCPICHMQLTRTIITSNDLKSQNVKLSTTQIELANIKIDTAIIRTISEDKTITGVATINENNIYQITSKIAGRIDHLYFKTTGEKIKAGEKLYEIYSEDLIAAQKEYLLAIEKRKFISQTVLDYNQLLVSAKNKLLLWGITEQQINNIANTEIVLNAMPIYATTSGTIIDIQVTEGGYVTEGNNIFRIADLSTIWVDAQLYANELKFFKTQNEVELTIPSIANKIFKGQLSFINPELEKESRIITARVEVSNADNQIIPGMMAYVKLITNKKTTLAIPISAIIQNDKMNMVWIRKNDNSFEPRMVTLGISNQDWVEIISGVSAGEVVVSSGVYLLNSEYIFKKGSTPMGEMDM